MCERRASMCRITFLQCGCVPGVCARDLVSDCQALIRQCNAAVFSVGEDVVVVVVVVIFHTKMGIAG